VAAVTQLMLVLMVEDPKSSRRCVSSMAIHKVPSECLHIRAEHRVLRGVKRSADVSTAVRSIRDCRHAKATLAPTALRSPRRHAVL
jgi:hypothetical protein